MMMPAEPRTTVEILLDRTRRMPDAPLLEARDGRLWTAVTAEQVWMRVEAVARGLMVAGIRRGDRVGIMSRTRPEWLIADFAIQAIGAVTVPLYETSSVEQVRHIAQDAGLVSVFVEDDRMAALVEQALPELWAGARPWVLDTGVLDRLAVAGGTIAPGSVQDRMRATLPQDLATIVYTSGTTERPRGVRLSHANLTVHAIATAQALPTVVTDGSPRLLLFLPLAHVYARSIALVCIAARTTLGLSPSATDLGRDAGSFRPTFLVAVPRVLEKAYAAAHDAAGSGPRRRVFDWAERIAVSDSLSRQQPGLAPPSRIRRTTARLLVLRLVRRHLGGRLDTVIVGGAALHPPIGHFFRGAGIDVLEGYGLTETCAQTTVNRPGQAVIGTVGVPLPGCRVMIDDADHVLVAGPHVFAGYEGEPARAGEWFDTGDLGRIDADGNLVLIGRAKDVLVTAQGKNVNPGPIEDHIRTHPLVAECVLVGEGRPFVGALVALDAEALANWRASRGESPIDLAAAADDATVRAWIGETVAEANATVSRAESVREFTILDRPLSIAEDHLTPSLKVRRARILAQFEPVLEELYARDRAAR